MSHQDEYFPKTRVADDTFRSRRTGEDAMIRAGREFQKKKPIHRRESRREISNECTDQTKSKNDKICIDAE